MPISDSGHAAETGQNKEARHQQQRNPVGDRHCEEIACRGEGHQCGKQEDAREIKDHGFAGSDRLSRGNWWSDSNIRIANSRPDGRRMSNPLLSVRLSDTAG
ncbi:MAG: hypothetical protein ACJAVZ_003470 [Afipia broomeae]|jgi:hypothetical protein